MTNTRSHRRPAPRWLALAAAGSTAALALVATPGPVAAREPCPHEGAHVLTSGLGSTLGSTVGPDGWIYVTDGVAGTVTKINPQTGTTRLVTSGLPTRVAPVGGAMDVAFLDGTAYVLVSLVAADVGGSSVDGVYRIDGPHTQTLVADIGAFAAAHPPATDYFIPDGVQFAMTTYRGAFLVTDGHHNRVYRATTSGHVSEVETFGNVVPTGINRERGRVYVAEAGPVPHLPADGKVVRIDPGAHTASDVASGARLAVDVVGTGHTLYALSQGELPAGGEPGTPALPSTGALLRVEPDGSMTPVAQDLDRPSSMQVIGHTAYVVTLTGEIDTIPLPH
jgi:sugar lactone lactonase YvrE